jgi:16S rRNA (guanine966-N2)-methyltransferase
MRIVGGRHRGRRLASPADRRIRPTADRARQALFDLLAHGPYGSDAGPAPRGQAVLDAFAGSGALGLEALSRGARRVTFIENDGEACHLIGHNAAPLAQPGEVEVLRRDATRPGAPPHAHDLLLMDPPYGSGLAAPALTALAAAGWLAADAVAVVEIGRDEAFGPPPGFAIVDQRAYGAARLVILRRG